MSSKVLIAGLTLRLQAALSAGLPDLQAVTASSTEEVLFLLESESFLALLIDESVIEEPQGFFVALDQAFLGTVMFLARGRHSADAIRDLVDRGPHSLVLQHPLEPADVVHRLAKQLGLPVLAHEGSELALDVELQAVWAENRELLKTRMQLLSRLCTTTPEEVTPEDLEEGWRAAFQMAGTLGSFGVHQGTLLAREAQALLAQAKETPLDIVRLERIVRLLEQRISEHGLSESTRESEGIVLYVGSDCDFARELEVEGVLLNWTVVHAQDKSQVLAHLAFPQVRAVALDQDSALAISEPEFVAELLADGIPTLVLSSQILNLPPASTHLRGLEKPAGAYQTLVNLLRMASAPAPEHPPSIFVLDDDPVVLMVIEATLSKADMHVQVLENPLTFWDHLASDVPDLIILDIDLPPSGGLDLCRALRNYPNYAGIPVMFISSYNDPETLGRAFEAGADDYLYKPVSSQELLVRVKNRLERTRQISLHSFPLYWCEDSLSRFSFSLMEAAKLGQRLSLASLSLPKQGLARLLRLLRRSLRAQDLIQIFAEDELLVALPGVSGAHARTRISSLMEWDEQHAWMGVSEFPTDGQELPTLIGVARQDRESTLPAIQINAVFETAVTNS